MKISQSDILFLSTHEEHHEVKEEESLHTWNRSEDAPQRLQEKDRLELSDKFNSLNEHEITLDAKTMSIIRALEALLGQKIDLTFYKEVHSDQSQEKRGWGMEYHYYKSEIHEESMQFKAQGSIRTEDGEEIEFTLNLQMNKRSEIYESTSLKAGDALIDPLVINFGNSIISMSEIKHNFDLDLDGKEDEFSFVKNNSGFLALDKNADKKINNGNELFGPTLGNGFEELSEYDDDRNGWIDENDSVYSKLLIWTKDEVGENLFTLKEKNVGAIYLESIKTDFELEDSQSSKVALLKESSVYLEEDGKVGTIQEIDLKI